MSNGTLTLTATVDTRQYTQGADTINKANSRMQSSAANAANAMSKANGQSGNSMDEVADKSAKGSGRIAAAFGVVAGVAQSVVTKAFNMVSDSISNAVSRVDTLNNFPKVLTNLGYSADESSQSIQRMADHLDGLPTTLNAMTAVTQRLAPISPSLSAATDTALALNDALLAGGASADVQSNAMEQLVQMMSAGKVDMQAWVSVNNAMPGQMNQVAKSILGASASTNDLYKAMKGGKVSTEQFAEAFIKLDKEGSDGLASFSAQAKDATGGISTSWANMKNGIVKGLADILNAIGASNIATVLGAVGKGFKSGLDIIAGAIPPVIDLIGKIVDWIHQFVDSITQTEGFQSFIQSVKNMAQPLMDMVGAIGNVVRQLFGFSNKSLEAGKSGTSFGDVLKRLSEVLNTAAKVIQNVSKWISQNSDVVAAGIVAMGTAFALFKIVGFIKSIGQAISSLKMLFGVLMANPIMLVVAAVAALVGGLIYFFTQTERGRQIWGQFTEWLKTTWETVSLFFKILWQEITKVFENAANGVRQVWKNVSDWFSHIWDGLSGAASKAWNAVTKVFTGAFKTIQGILKNIATVVGAIPVWIGQKLLDGINKVFSKIMDVLTGWYDNSSGFIHTALGGIIGFVSGVWNTLSRIVQTGIDFIRTIVVAVIDLISGDWQGAWSTISSFFSGIWNGIVAFFSPIINSIKNTISNVLNTIQGIWDSIWGAISGFVSGIWNSISSTVGGYINAVSSVIGSVLGAIQGVWNNVWSAVSGFVGNIWNGIVNAVKGGIGRVANVVGSIKDTVLGAVSGAGEWLYDTGRNIISGLIGGIKGAFEWLKNTITNLGHSVVEWAKGVLHIGSPSKVFRDEIGKWIPAGISVGIDKGMPSLREDLSADMNSLVKAYQPVSVVNQTAPIRPLSPVTSGYVPTSAPVSTSTKPTVTAPITVQTNDPMAAGMEAARIINFHFV